MNKKQENIINLARKRLRIAIDAVSESRESEIEDLKFLAGSPDNQWQWPQEVINTRTGNTGGMASARPCLTINKLPQHVNQVTNDQKANRPSGKIIPVNDEADVETANALTDMIRHIEYISDADVAYDTACLGQVVNGEGYFRLLTDYIDEDSFEQEIKIGRIRNPFSVYLDPMIQDPCGSDAEWGFITSNITWEEFERKYPKAHAKSTLEQHARGDETFGDWISNDTVRISEYFYVTYERSELHLYPGEQVVEAGSAIANEFSARGIEPIRKRSVQKRRIKWCKINGYEILEEAEWPGKWIPIIRLVGNEYEIEGKLEISGLVRNAKDPQRMYNYWASQEAEMLALAPKAPFVGYAGQFEGYEYQWKTANNIPWPYLEVNPDIVDGQGQTLPLPQRSQPPMAQQGLIAAKMGASDDIKSTTGQYDSSLGQTSNERSGKAILARERQTDTGTYHYVDNLSRAIRYSTRQIIDLIPKVYDTRRIVRIMGEDGEQGDMKIDPEQQDSRLDIVDDSGNVIDSIFNPGVGKYDVRVVTGPGYTTKRQEAAEAMANLVQGNPELWQIAGDLIVKGLDWPGADKLADRLKRSIDPKLLDDKQSPELTQAQQQIEEMGQTMQQMKQMLDNIQNSFEKRELDIKAYEAETKRISAVSGENDDDRIQDIVLGTLDGIMDSQDIDDNSGGVINSNPNGKQ